MNIFDLFPVKTHNTNKKYANFWFASQIFIFQKFKKLVCDTLLLVIVNGKKHKICYIREIVGGDRFSAGPLKVYIFYAICFLYVFQKKSQNKLWIRTHACYFLFNTFFSQVNNKWFFFHHPIPLRKIINPRVGKVHISELQKNKSVMIFNLVNSNRINQITMQNIYFWLEISKLLWSSPRKFFIYQNLNDSTKLTSM